MSNPWQVVIAGLVFLGAAAPIAAAQCPPQEIVAPGSVPLTYFGNSIALDQHRLIISGVGAFAEYQPGPSGWTLKATYLPPASAGTGQFGASVALQAGRLVVGAPASSSGIGSTGTAYVYDTDPSGTLQLSASLTAPEASPLGPTYFGGATALSGDRLAIGAPGGLSAFGFASGAVYVYTLLPTSGWTPVAKLAPTPPVLGGADEFGSSCAMEGERVVVGMPGDNAFGHASGAVFVFEKLGPTWVQTAVLRASDAASGDALGRCVALAGDRIVAGAPGVGDGFSSTGAVYVFEKLAGGWTETARLIPSTSSPYSQFGMSVTLAGGRLAVGAQFAAYLLERSASGWKQLAYFDLFQPHQNPLGMGLVLDDTSLVVGSSYHLGTGGAWAFDVSHAGDSFVPCVDTIAVSSGGVASMSLTAGPTQAAAPYLVLGSVSGTSPGLMVGSVPLPLNPDAYFSLLATNPNSVILPDSLGTLDANGNALVHLVLPAGLPPALAGLTLWHASLVFSTAGAPVAGTNAVSLLLTP